MASPANENVIKRILRTLSKASFLSISLFLHIVLIAALGGTIVFERIEVAKSAEGSGATAILPGVQLNLSEQLESDLDVLTTVNKLDSRLSLPVDVPRVNQPVPEEAEQLVGGGQGGGSGIKPEDTEKPDSESAIILQRKRSFDFTAYLGKYADGNWDATVVQRDDRIIKGSLTNFVYTVQQWSGDQINANLQPQVIDLSDETAILAAKPPFIFFNGQRNFILKEDEVRTLQRYIRLGGVIWGDSQLAGRGSAFDVAFRREMRRVVADDAADFEALPASHAIFTGGYWLDVTEVVPGMNFTNEPIEVLRVMGGIAVLYTPNNYCDMWQIGLAADGSYEFGRDMDDNYVAINIEMYNLRDIYFRNLEPEAVADSLKFGTNITLYLLNRWESRSAATPGL